MTKSVFGLSENLAAAFSYLIVVITGLLVFTLERENKFVRFHALQAALVGIAYLVLRFIAGMIPFFSGLFLWAMSLAYFCLVVYMMYMAFRGITFKLPYVGEAAYKQVNK